MRSVISSAIDPRARAVPRSAATPGMRTCWGSARSSTSCIRRASNWSAQCERGRAVLDGASEAQLALLGPAVADPDALTGLVDDDLPLDDSEEAQLEWEQVQAEWIATGFPGCEPAFPVAKDQPRAVDEGFVIVEPDEVKTKAQPSTGRKEVWTFTAVVLVAGLRYAFAEATAEGLWLQVSALLLQLGVLSGERRLLVLGDGAAWIRAWFESLGISLQAMILCWWHLRKRCYESMSSAGGAKDLRRAFEKELLGQLWEGKVNAAIELLKGALEWVRNPAAVEELIAYLGVCPRIRVRNPQVIASKQLASFEPN